MKLRYIPLILIAVFSFCVSGIYAAEERMENYDEATESVFEGLIAHGKKAVPTGTNGSKEAQYTVGKNRTILVVIVNRSLTDSVNILLYKNDKQLKKKSLPPFSQYIYLNEEENQKATYRLVLHSTGTHFKGAIG